MFFFSHFSCRHENHSLPEFLISSWKLPRDFSPENPPPNLGNLDISQTPRQDRVPPKHKFNYSRRIYLSFNPLSPQLTNKTYLVHIYKHTFTRTYSFLSKKMNLHFLCNRQSSCISHYLIRSHSILLLFVSPIVSLCGP